MRSMPKRLPTEIDMIEYGHFGDFNDKRKRSVPFSKLKKAFPEGLPNNFWNHFSMDYPLITLLLSETWEHSQMVIISCLIRGIG